MDDAEGSHPHHTSRHPLSSRVGHVLTDTTPLHRQSVRRCLEVTEPQSTTPLSEDVTCLTRIQLDYSHLLRKKDLQSKRRWDEVDLSDDATGFSIVLDSTGDRYVVVATCSDARGDPSDALMEDEIEIKSGSFSAK